MNLIEMRFPGGVAKTLTLSYDDAVQEDFRLIKIMKQYGLKGTFNINSNDYKEDGYYKDGDSLIGRRMPISKATALYGQEGIEPALHSLTHAHLETLPKAQIAYEIVKDRENLEKQFDHIVRGMAYPFGTYNNDVISVLEECGIVYCRTVKSTGRFDLPTDWLRLDPTCHHNDPRLSELTRKFVDESPDSNRRPWSVCRPWMFYLWGHAYEFASNDNWEIIENFAKEISGKPDIWYATNIEIYEYVANFKRLVFSMDLERVKNPTAQDLWLMKNQTLFHIPAGKTVSLHCTD